MNCVFKAKGKRHKSMNRVTNSPWFSFSFFWSSHYLTRDWLTQSNHKIDNNVSLSSSVSRHQKKEESNVITWNLCICGKGKVQWAAHPRFGPPFNRSTHGNSPPFSVFIHLDHDTIFSHPYILLWMKWPFKWEWIRQSSTTFNSDCEENEKRKWNSHGSWSSSSSSSGYVTCYEFILLFFSFCELNRSMIMLSARSKHIKTRV